MKTKRLTLLRPRLPFGHRFRLPLVVTLCLAVGLGFAPWITFTVGQGQVTAIDPNERVQSLTAPVDGFIGAWYVREGQSVQAGEVIADLVDIDPQRIERLRQQREAAENALASAELVVETANIDFQRQEKLFKQGLSARKDYELAKIKVEQLNLDRAKAVADFTKIQSDYSRQSSQRIVAPRNGIVTRILPGEKGQLIKSGTPILVFTPEVTRPAVEVWVEGNDSAYLRTGMTARIQFEGWPTMQIPGWPSLAINTFKGKVYLVDRASSLKGSFRILIVPDGPWPSDELLRLGLQARSYVRIRDSFVLREIWRILNGFPPLQEPINNELDRILSNPTTGFSANGEKK